jgi:hypothetical protein
MSNKKIIELSEQLYTIYSDTLNEKEKMIKDNIEILKKDNNDLFEKEKAVSILSNEIHNYLDEKKETPKLEEHEKFSKEEINVANYVAKYRPDIKNQLTFEQCFLIALYKINKKTIEKIIGSNIDPFFNPKRINMFKEYITRK